MCVTNAEQTSLFQGYAIPDSFSQARCRSFLSKLTVFLKPVVGLFSQRYKLERPDSDAQTRFFCGVVGQGLEDLQRQKCERKVVYMSEEDGSGRQDKG